MPERQLPSILKDQYVVDTSPWAARIRAEFGALVVCTFSETTGVEVPWRIRNLGSHHDVRYSGVWIAAVLETPVGRPTQPAVSGPGTIGHFETFGTAG